MSRLGPWGGRRIAVAVSGGPDSLALALLTHDWCRAHDRAMIALTVDHGLRPEAAGEARDVASLMAANQIPCHILTIPDLARGSALPARARDARYQALFAACHQAGIIDLLLGHHTRDQAETLLMRRARSSGPSGLAAMAAVSVRDGIRLVRPLLATSHDTLRAELRARCIAWIDDPSNRDQRATRARIRAGLDGTAIEALAAQAKTAGRARTETEIATATWLAQNAIIRPEGFAYLLTGACPAESLTALIQTIGGLAYPPPSASIARLAGKLRAATLAGVRIIRHDGKFVLLREQSAIAPPVPAEQNTVWDQRFRVLEPGHLSPDATIGVLGTDAARLRDLSDLPAAILATLPAIRSGTDLPHVPFLPANHLNPDTGAVLRFNPPRPAAGALFRAVDN